MCRLAAYEGAPLSLDVLVFQGDHALYRQSWAPRELLSGSVNVDGYGIVWPGDPHTPLRRLARLEPVWHDPDLPGTLAEVSAERSLAALRNATPGLPVDRAGLLPLVHGPWALAMNGYIPGFRERHMRALREPLSDEWYARLHGSSDAETLFLRLVQLLEEGSGPGEALLAIRDAVGRRLDPGEVSPLTMVLLGPEGVTALHTTLNGAVNSLYRASGTEMAPEGALLASEPLDDDAQWEAVPPHSLVRMTRDGTEITPL